MLLTLVVGTLGGAVAFLLKLPIPWLVGSLLATIFYKRFFLISPPAKKFSSWMRVLLGVALGGSVASSLVGFDKSLFILLFAAIVFVVAVTIIGVWYFRQVPSFNSLDAFMSALPGGLTFLMSLSNDLGDRFPRIALIHAVRMVLLILMFSVLAYFHGVEASQGTIISAFAINIDVNLWKIIVLCVLSGLLADKLKVPGGHIMFPMIIAAVVYSSGLITIPMPELIKTLAMVTFGSVLGCKLSARSFSEYREPIKASVIFTAFAIVTALLMALGLSELLGKSYFLFFLALAPGGIAEISLIALALGFDVGFVAVVHTCRYLFIMLIGVLGMNALNARQLKKV